MPKESKTEGGGSKYLFPSFLGVRTENFVDRLERRRAGEGRGGESACVDAARREEGRFVKGLREPVGKEGRNMSWMNLMAFCITRLVGRWPISYNPKSPAQVNHHLARMNWLTFCSRK